MLVFTGPGMVDATVNALPDRAARAVGPALSRAYGDLVRYLGLTALRALVVGAVVFAAAESLSIDMPALLAVVARVLDGRVDQLTDRVDEWLRKGRVLRRSRSTPADDRSSGFAEYSRRTDPVAGAQRAVHAVRGGERLAHVRRVRVVVCELDDRRCVVGLLVDATRSRRNAAAGGTAVTVTGVAASAAGLLPWAWGAAVAGAVASGAAGVGVMWTRKAYTSQVTDELESVLDAVASGERPPSVIDGVTSRLLRPSRP